MIPLLLLSLAVLGTFNAAYLTYIHIYSSGVCGPDSTCGQVLTSSYASLGGLPIASYGLGFYLAVLCASWRSLWAEPRDEAIRWVSILGLVGSLPTLWFLYLQAVVIGAFCPYCLLSAFLILTLTALALLHRKNTRTLKPLVGTLTSPHLIPIVLALVVAPMTAGTLQHAKSSQHSQETNPEVVARIGDREITLSEMDDGIKLKLYETRSAYREEWLEQQVLEAAAQEAGIDARAFIQQEVYKKISVNQEEIDRRYVDIKPRLPRNVTKKMVTPNIRDEIAGRKRKEALDAFATTLNQRYGTFYTAPISERFTFTPNDRSGPEKGPEDALVTIVEYSDLECSYCSRAHGYLTELAKRRGNEIRMIYKHYPLEMHPHAFFAAEIAACAHRQGLFWPLSDLLFKQQKTFSDNKIRTFAEQVGLDMVKLNACIDSGEGKRAVEADIAEGDALGISSTPSFFVNGHYIGSLPPEGLDALIDRELGLTGLERPDPALP